MMGCVGHISQVEALDDGRYNIVLEGAEFCGWCANST